MILDAKGKRAIRVLIAMPCDNTVNAGTAYDLAALYGHESGRDMWLAMDRGTILPAQRTRLVQRAIELKASHVLWIDSDMRFPKDVLSRLLAHDLPIVAANYTTRRSPYLPVAQHGKLGYLFTSPAQTGLVEVGHTGMGMMLVDTRVYAAVAPPWFALGFIKSDNSYVGEDVYFGRMAANRGFPTMVDTDLSKEIGHVGEIDFMLEHANITREKAREK